MRAHRLAMMRPAAGQGFLPCTTPLGARARLPSLSPLSHPIACSPLPPPRTPVLHPFCVLHPAAQPMMNLSTWAQCCGVAGSLLVRKNLPGEPTLLGANGAAMLQSEACAFWIILLHGYHRNQLIVLVSVTRSGCSLRLAHFGSPNCSLPIPVDCVGFCHERLHVARPG